MCVVIVTLTCVAMVTLTCVAMVTLTCVTMVTLTCVAMVTLTCVAMVTSLQTCEEKLGKLNPDNNQMIVLSMYETYSGCKVIQL